MLSFDEYAAHDAIGLMALLGRGEVTAKELHDIAVQAVEMLDPRLNAVVMRAEADAQQALSALRADAPFAGLPFLVKEGVGMKGQRAAMACRLAPDLLCDSDSEFVRRLKASGVVILGSTNVPELGASPTTESSLHGPARNPWNPAHSTGGSSGGSSAAVAAGIVPVAQSSDGAGSIRTPANWCGHFGLKPTRGRNAVGPQGYGGPFGVGCQHVSSRSVRDSAAFLDVLHGPEPGAFYRVCAPQRSFLQEVGAPTGRLRVACSPASPSGIAADPEVVRAVDGAARLLADLGHHVDEAAPRYDWEQFFEAFGDVFNSGFPIGIGMLESATGLQAGPDTLESGTMAALQHGRDVSLERYLMSTQQLFGITRQFESFFDRWDFYLCPVNLTPARRLGELNPALPFESFRQWWDLCIAPVCPHTPIVNVAGLPAMALPFTLSSDGLPIGVQVIGRHGSEAALLRLAAQVEAARPWSHRRPPVHVAAIGAA